MKTYTKRELAYLLGCSIRTINDDCTHLGIVPQKGDRNMNLYTERDFNLISQLREHCKDKHSSRDSFIPMAIPEVLEDELKVEPKVSKLSTKRTTRGDEATSSPASLLNAARDAPSRDRLTHTSRFEWEASHSKADYAIDVFSPPVSDPFFDLELLQRISDRKWLLPAKRLAPLLGISASYLNSKNRYFYCGFVATKEAYVQNKALWKIESSNSKCPELVKHS